MLQVFILLRNILEKLKKNTFHKFIQRMFEKGEFKIKLSHDSHFANYAEHPQLIT